MGRSNLTDEQKKVLFEGHTEAPFTGKLLDNKKSGDYMCVNCGAKLFDSHAKFDSKSGWPSFYEADNNTVKLREDNSHGMQRQEVLCAKCGGHLGHLFDDAPDQPTGMRYCINSCILDFNEREAE